MLTPYRNISRPTAKDKRATVTVRTAARRKPHRNHHQPDLFGAVEPRFDPKKLTKWALGIWRSSMDARHSVLCERWAASQNLTLPDDIDGDVLRFHPSLSYRDDRAPGLIFLLRDLHTDEPVGILRYFLDDDGTLIGRRALGRVYNTAIKFDADEHVSTGLHLASTVETGIAAMNSGLRPVWSIIGANVAEFPVIGGIEALTFVTDDDNARAVTECAARYREHGREVMIAETASPPPAVWDAGDGDP